ncbi:MULTISPECIES: ANTAR domain-containing response regulator [Roseovarius]|uniref:ANTAR domain-containing response regulator n=1 Tax=Roseovarius TaxID=74030 RepID=UPI001C97BC59|nr:ANTAR domain-containing protein [Roseovarius atlanticus]MBY5987206.1 ANTAR domain-containing protein [Roseovarius atlanticus]MBY6125846.1 ANTAR domain-containing protein [Roseovarius atlanticus]MBY6149693.1 ANTAR domain-containing protein [Roseovarius atlanticus]
MKKILRNFRGMRALVLQGDVTGRDKLLQTLRKLGLDAEAVAPETASRELIDSADLIFVDADEGIDPIFDDASLPDVPIIAIIGNEAPSRLSRVVKVRAASHIQKPVRSSGVFTAVLLGINEFAQRQRMAQEADVLRRRLAGRRVVVKAVIALMRRWGIDETVAYERLRSVAMRERISVEDVAARVLETPNDDPTTERRVGSRE